LCSPTGQRDEVIHGVGRAFCIHLHAPDLAPIEELRAVIGRIRVEHGHILTSLTSFVEQRLRRNPALGLAQGCRLGTLRDLIKPFGAKDRVDGVGSESHALIVLAETSDGRGV
jgi:hypothetical protein